MSEETIKKLDEIKDTLESLEETISNRIEELIQVIREKK
jgi:hypothetical protein